MSAPISIRTPELEKMPGSPERAKRYFEACYKKLPFALRNDDVKKQFAGKRPGGCLVDGA